MPLTPVQKEAVRWLGGAVLIAIVIGLLVALTRPEFDLLALYYAVL